jgi:hypothetical protein
VDPPVPDPSSAAKRAKAPTILKGNSLVAAYDPSVLSQMQNLQNLQMKARVAIFYYLEPAL